jgi:hypothetical protein
VVWSVWESVERVWESECAACGRLSVVWSVWESVERVWGSECAACGRVWSGFGGESVLRVGD